MLTKTDNEILITGNLHIYDVPWSVFKSQGIIVHVEGDVIIHRKEDDFVYPKTDTFIDNLFDKYDVKDIIAYSQKFKENH